MTESDWSQSSILAKQWKARIFTPDSSQTSKYQNRPIYHFKKSLSLDIFLIFNVCQREITIYSLFGSPCSCKFGHQMAPLALVANWATIICIVSKFGHQVAPLALVLKLATRLHHCIATFSWIARLALSVGIELLSSSARVTSVKSAKGGLLSYRQPDP